MSRKFIAAVLVASLTITGIAASSAQAGDRNHNGDEIAKILVGATALFMIGKALSGKRSEPDYKPIPKPLPPRVKRKRLPGECLRSYRVHGGRVEMASKRCLERKYHYVSSLPRSCKISQQTRKGYRRGYSPRCLKKHGYSFVW